jgi:diphthamide synthase (EF-2-diphthine--ammonia ligase)
MASAIERIRLEWRATHVAFGDLFLQDVRAYREERMRGTGLEPLFPLWLRPTARLAALMIAAGMRTRVVCLDPTKVPRELAGRLLDQDLLDSLPPGVDPCGERGEFHTFVTEGPMLRGRVAAEPGEVVEREGFVFADLVPAA